MTDLGNGLFAVSVPEDASRFIIQPSEAGNTILHYTVGLKILDIGPNLEILGTVTKDNIDFDVEPYVEILETIDRGYFKEKIYKDYIGDMIYYYSKNKSFLSLLSSKGLYFENPYGNPTSIKGFTSQENKKLKSELFKWQQAQNNLIEKLVIIKKV